jgi:hypothetical protein
MMHSTPRLGAEQSAHELEVMCGGFQKDVKGEDRFTIHDAIIAGDHCYFAVVADGHGGQDAVIHAAKRILPLIAEAAADGSSVELNRASVQSFRALHEEIFASGTTSGSTLTVCCINASKHELHVWNVGDSLAVLVDATSHAPLGVGHRLESNPEEQAPVTGTGCKRSAPSSPAQRQKGAKRADRCELGPAALPSPAPSATPTALGSSSPILRGPRAQSPPRVARCSLALTACGTS